MVSQVELFSFIFWKNWRHQRDISELTDLYNQPTPPGIWKSNDAYVVYSNFNFYGNQKYQFCCMCFNLIRLFTNVEHTVYDFTRVL